ncbi:MAG: prepilin-type N-terminal cleavage/methylation domain-containing protein [Candidatus Omnitrophica bacterium]|nr:prepilin-type N-terminal cleavage/methylation domain-containing protein [Candidatus Omnitrophota bacterium]
MTNKRAVTLIELVVVVTILAIFASIVSGIYVNYHLRTKASAEKSICIEKRKQIQYAEELFVEDLGNHSENLQNLVNGGYLTDIPGCPSGGVYAWMPHDEGDPLYQTQVVCSVHGTINPPTEAEVKQEKEKGKEKHKK